MGTTTVEPEAPDRTVRPDRPGRSATTTADPAPPPPPNGLVPDRDELATMSAHDLVVLYQELERTRRVVEAALVEVVAMAESRDLPRGDGHSSPTNWCVALGGWSRAEALQRVRAGRLARDDDSFAAAMRSGRIGVAHGHRLARAYANPRCGHLLPGVMDSMLAEAEALPFEEFRTIVDRWEMLVDADGAHRDADATHQRRRASITNVGLTGELHAAGCTSSTAAMAEILDAFTQAEWDTDWALARQQHGDRATSSDLRRTDAQRRFDALQRIFERAAGSPTDAGPAVTVNYVIDHDTVARLLGRAGDSSDSSGPGSVATGDSPIDPRRLRCETITGNVVPPATVLDAMWWGRIRRVVIDSAGVPVEMGRRQRLFTGAARDAVMLMATHCINPGCPLPVTRCQGSHLVDWQHHGPTEPRNGAPECGRHNRLHNHGFSVRRDTSGRWHTYRPDGTELTDPPAPET